MLLEVENIFCIVCSWYFSSVYKHESLYNVIEWTQTIYKGHLTNEHMKEGIFTYDNTVLIPTWLFRLGSFLIINTLSSSHGWPILVIVRWSTIAGRTLYMYNTVTSSQNKGQCFGSFYTWIYCNNRFKKHWIFVGHLKQVPLFTSSLSYKFYPLPHDQ